MGNLLDKYLFQALDAYPYDLEETVESLNYALSYDAKNPTALCLMGRLHAEVLSDYETAKEYFQQALAENIHAVEVYIHYASVLLCNEDYKEAEKLLDYALTIKGADKAILYAMKAVMYEHLTSYRKALKCLKKAKVHAYNNCYTEGIKGEVTRIKEKMPKKKKKKKGSKKKSKSSSDKKKKKNKKK